MKKALLPALVIAVGAYYVLAPTGNNDSDPGAHQPPDSMALPDPAPAATSTLAATAGTAPASGSAVLRSPFGRAAPAPARPLADRVQERREHMLAMGINTPDAYYAMSLHELRQRAASKDVMAMLQLAVQYGAETSDLEGEAGYDPAIDPRTEQKKYLVSAVNAGHIRSAAVLARLYSQENNAVDAYAWHLLAERLGDSSGSTWARETFARVSQAHRQAAGEKAQALFSQANQRFVVQPAGGAAAAAP